MTDQPHRPTEIGLVLQGGGALGAYEWGAVTALLELMEKAETRGRHVVLKVVTGVSIGAINGACIVGSRTRADARRRLTDLWEDLRLDTPSFLPRQVRRNRGLAHKDKDPNVRKPEIDEEVVIRPRHILASASLAPAFPWTEINGRKYWDGGLVDNTPLGDAIDAFSDTPEVDRLLVVMNMYPLRARLP